MIIVDVETTGTEPHKHSLLSIAAIDLSDPSRQFYEECRTWEGAHVDLDALVYNGFTTEEIKDQSKKSDQEIVSDFLDWIQPSSEHTLAGQNVFFDRDFLKYTAERYHLNWPLAQRIVDLHSVCYAHMIERGVAPPIKNGHSALDSDSICDYVGLPKEVKPHRSAMKGAKWEAEAFQRLLFNKSLLEEFNKFPIPWISKN